MADREVAFWKRITDALWKPNRVFMRMEIGFVDGVPDGLTIIDGATSFVELKCPTPSGKPRAATALFSGQHKLSREQINWAVACRQAGGRWFCGIETPLHVLLVGARHVESINTMPLSKLIEVADFAWRRPMDAGAWDAFRMTLSMKGLP